MSPARLALVVVVTQALACGSPPAAAGPSAPLSRPEASAPGTSTPPTPGDRPAPDAQHPSVRTETSATPPPQTAMLGPGCPTTIPERPAAPPDRKIFGKCAYYAGCPKAAPSTAIPVCPPDLEVVSVRQLRSEGGRRKQGSPIAIRGRAQWQARLRGLVGLTEPGTIHVGPPPCEVGPAVLYLASDDTGPCLFAGAALTTNAGALGCHGDITDRCCRTNPGFPALDSVVVAIGSYGGTGSLLGGDRVDQLVLESYCYPAAHAALAERGLR